MSGNEHNNFEKKQDKFIERILVLYDEKSKNFRNILVLMLIFTIVFLFIIFLPYISLLDQNKQINQQLLDVSQQIRERQYDLHNYMRALNGTSLLENKINNDVNTIFKEQETEIMRLSRNINYINRPSLLENKISYDLNDQILSTTHHNNHLINTLSFMGSDNMTLIECKEFHDNSEHEICVQTMMMIKKIEEYDQTFNDYVVAPLAGMKIDLDNILIIQNAINDLIEENRKILSSIRMKNASSIISNDTFPNGTLNREKWNFGFPVDTELEFLKVFSNIERLIKRINASLSFNIEKIENEIKKLSFDEKQLLQIESFLKNEKVEIADRLNQIQFPFGKLPIKLDDAVMIFPILLAIGFVIDIHLLCRSIYLRKNFHDLYRRKDPNQTTLRDRDIALIAPLWIDPLDSKVNQIIRFIIILIPFIIFIFAWYLISYYLIFSESNLNIALHHGSINQSIYNIFYTFCLILFIYSCWKLTIQLRSYVGIRQKVNR